MSNEAVWSSLKHFTREENWGNPDMMDPHFLMGLDDYRDEVGKPCQLTCPAFARTGHACQSYHYLGMAADLRFVDPETWRPLSLEEHIIIALRSPFGGVGIYTWSHDPFIHFDDRPIGKDRKIWVSEKEGEYQNLSIEFLEKVFGGSPS